MKWTVASLIKELQKYDDRVKVYIDNGCGCCSDGDKGIKVEQNRFMETESFLIVGSEPNE